MNRPDAPHQNGTGTLSREAIRCRLIEIRAEVQRLIARVQPDTARVTKAEGEAILSRGLELQSEQRELLARIDQGDVPGAERFSMD